jgi:hypothetical protein
MRGSAWLHPGKAVIAISPVTEAYRITNNWSVNA